MRGRRFFCSGGGPPFPCEESSSSVSVAAEVVPASYGPYVLLASAFVVSGGVWKFLFEAGMLGSGFHEMLGGAPATMVRARCREVRSASCPPHQQEPEMLVSPLPSPSAWHALTVTPPPPAPPTLL